MKKLAESSGTVAFEHNNVVTLARKPAQWTSTFLFVSGLVAFITIANGILQFFIGSTNGQVRIFAFVLSGVGLLVLFLFIVVLRFRRKINAKPLDQLKIICAFDFNSGKLRDNKLQVVANISESRLKRSMQVTSSSPLLRIASPETSIILVRGNPFSGGISAVEKLLLSRGIRK